MPIHIYQIRLIKHDLQIHVSFTLKRKSSPRPKIANKLHVAGIGAIPPYFNSFQDYIPFCINGVIKVILRQSRLI
jgi:hypothetical protein